MKCVKCIQKIIKAQLNQNVGPLVNSINTLCAAFVPADYKRLAIKVGHGVDTSYDFGP
jgi:hypothetical protein